MIFFAIFALFFSNKNLDSEEIDQKSDSDSDLEDDGGHTGLLDNSEDVSNSLTTPSRGRQMNAENLDGKIVKALKKQEEKRDKRAQRKKEVIIYSKSSAFLHFTPFFSVSRIVCAQA